VQLAQFFVPEVLFAGRFSPCLIVRPVLFRLSNPQELLDHASVVAAPEPHALRPAQTALQDSQPAIAPSITGDRFLTVFIRHTPFVLPRAEEFSKPTVRQLHDQLLP